MLVITLPAGNHERFFAEAGEPKANASEPMSTEPPDRALAHLATVMPDGSPHVTPVGVDYDGIHILINTVRGRRKERNMRQRPQVGLTIVDPTNPWHWLSIRGHVVAVTEEGADEHLKKLVKKYTGSDDTSFFRRPGQVYVIYKIEPDRVIATPPPQW